MATPSTTSVFTCYSTEVTKLLSKIDDGEIQLPDFQRDWVWDDGRICNLVANVALSYPIGAIMLLEINKDTVNFEAREIQGAPKNNNAPDQLILDGQQRLTSLYVSLFSRNAALVKRVRGNKKEKRFFYLNIEKCLNLTKHREEAVFSVSENRKGGNLKNSQNYDISSKEKEYEGKFFPLNIVTDKNAVNHWFDKYNDYHKEKEEYENNRNKINFFRNITSAIYNYKVPVIKLEKETPKEAICQVFTSVNQGGVALKTFDLLTAIYASKNKEPNLRDDWKKIKEELSINIDSTNILNAVDENGFIQAITLLTNYEKNREKIPGCRNDDILNLSLESYEKNKKRIMKGFEQANLLLTEEKISSNMLPYDTQLIPLAVICAAFKDSKKVNIKIKQWYWHGVFSEAYAGSTETQFSKDIFQMHKWIENDEKHDLFQESINIGRILRAKTRNSAVYKGVISLLDKEKSLDFITEHSSDDMKKSVGVDVHHIFPKKHCKEQKYKENKIESVVNKTRILPKTNKEIAGDAPSVYLKKIQNGKSEDELISILETHSIDYNFLIKDNFDGFILDRSKRLLKLIENVVGKSVVVSDEEIKEIFDSQ